MQNHTDSKQISILWLKTIQKGLIEASHWDKNPQLIQKSHFENAQF